MAACIWNDFTLSFSPEELSRVPAHIGEALQRPSNSEYLDGLAELALLPHWTETIFARYNLLFADLSARWWRRVREMPTLALKCTLAISRILPRATPLLAIVEDIVYKERLDIFGTLAASQTAVLQLSESTLSDVLLLFLRLLRCDNERFSSMMSPAQVQLLLSHSALHIRTLAAKCICLVCHLNESSFIGLMDMYVPIPDVEAEWEGKIINYRFFDLWESKRQKNLHLSLHESNKKFAVDTRRPSRMIQASDLSPLTVNFAGYLASLTQDGSLIPTSMTLTPTSSRNLAVAAKAICESDAVLVTGLAGSGKTTVIQDIARRTNHLSSMLTLHLNEQTDAKLLIGVYTTSVEGGSFKWQPGVLTTAVTQGHWVLIEDLDRAPLEVVSVLLPLLDRRELMVPNLGGPIRASLGFKLIATVRSGLDSRSEELNSVAKMVGYQHWTNVRFEPYTEPDLHQIIKDRFPLLEAHRTKFLKMYRAVEHPALNSGMSHMNVRPCGPRDILRFCSRVDKVLRHAGISNNGDAISEGTHDSIFLEAVDCFSSYVADGQGKTQIARIIAQELNVPETRMKYCLESRKPQFRLEKKGLEVGRVALRKNTSGMSKGISVSKDRIFAITGHSLRTMEAIAAAIRSKEPCLLVGETGIGKTAVIQELASLLGHKLIVINMSQQSEAGDLLGGFKPVNIKSLATPIKDEFDTLFEETFSSAKNDHYKSSVSRAFRKAEWAKLLKLWEEALRMIDTTFSSKANGHTAGENPPKKRKVESARYQHIKVKWDSLATQIQIFGKHLKSGSKGFAFSFVEGSIVKAVRNGDWVLLDEINLASPDTLESLADLLASGDGNTPSLLLTETGVAQRVQAHPNFRIFAAMNPATDVGKKNLPPSMRSRFTEHFISSPEEDKDSLLQIVQTYMGNLAGKDFQLPQKVANLYLDIRALENEHRLRDGANQRPHFTLRTLTRALTFANDVAPIYGYRRALYEGFAMSFLTALDRQSASEVQLRIVDHILKPHSNMKAILSQVPRCPGSPHDYIQFQHYWMTRGPGPPKEQPHYILTPFVKDNLMHLVRATSAKRYPVLLQGPTSSGKTSMVDYLAKLSGHTFVRINNHEHTDLQEYLGTYVSGPNGLVFQEGALVRALREGHWLVLDELNLAPTDILEALNRLLDDNRELFLPETQEVVRPHKNFMLFATQNPPGLYGGRKVLSRAFRNRFLELHFDDIPEGELETILRGRSQIAPSYCTRIVEVYKRLAVLRQSTRLFEQKNSFATLRDLFRWASRQADNVEQLAINGLMLLAERVRSPTERKEVKEIIEDVMRVKMEEREVYHLDRLTTLTSPTGGSMRKSVVATKGIVRLLTLVCRALENGEPVLLVGETGCGKTTACQLAAELFGTQLHILNAHQNTETGDLIGAQRPVRNRQNLVDALRQDIETIPEVALTTAKGGRPDIGTLIKAYLNLPQDVKKRLSQDLKGRIEAFQVSASALFEWSDGNLIRAMKAGHHFLLDEISLADDSVLERLNSVLEPSRSIFLAEKGSLDAFVVADDNFQFLATMNPGGDYGKKELSPALRNRFTEIWVPPPDDEDDLLQIAGTKLLPHLAELASPLLSFSRWFDEEFYEGFASVSIRQILAWIDFLNLSPKAEVSTAIVHGAALTYIDSLGANPSGKVVTTKEQVFEGRQACLDKLSSCFKLDVAAIYNDRIELVVETERLTVGRYSITKRTNELHPLSYDLNTPTTLRNTMRVVRALQLPKPLLIEGNPGVGKSTLISALAGIVNVKLTRLNLSEQTDIMDLFGSDVPVEDGAAGQFQWRDGPFLQAMQRGDWVLLDEMNLASQSILEGLNACLDHRGQVYIPELDRTFDRHPDFKLFAAQNPFSQGGGRKGLPTSFVNRFTIVYADALFEKDMLSISTTLYPHIPDAVATEIIRFTADLERHAMESSMSTSPGAPWEFNLRDVLRWFQLLSTDKALFSGISPSGFKSMLFWNRLRSPQSVENARDSVQLVTSPSPNFHACNRNINPAFLQCGYGTLERHGVSTVQARAGFRHAPDILGSVLITLQMRWPCLLVGPSGSGKTALINYLASVHGAQLSTLSLNSDMDAMDLVGGYEQFDNSRHRLKFLGQLRQAVEDHLADRILAGQRLDTDFCRLLDFALRPPADLQDCLTAFGILLEHFPHDLKDLESQYAAIVEKNSSDSRARFEWVDSILIEAMTNGHWLVLDNANLCSSSVLDRLNALLEPNGVLTINEHRSADGSPTTIVPHEKFRLFLTMDPRHGELSRAMRNRCVELYLPGDAAVTTNLSDDAMVNSDLSRLCHLGSFEWDLMTSEEIAMMAEVCIDHLAIGDLELMDAWAREISRGLLNVNPVTQRILLQSFHLMAQATRNTPMIAGILDLYALIFSKLESSAKRDAAVHWQPLNLLNNPPLIYHLYGTRNFHKAVWIADSLDAIFVIARILRHLASPIDSPNQDGHAELTRLERSLLAPQIRKYEKDSTTAIAKFLHQASEAALRWTQHAYAAVEVDQDYPWQVIHYLRDTLRLSQTLPFEEAKFQRYLKIGKHLGEALRQDPHSSQIGEALVNSLRLFDEGWTLTTGFCLEALWCTFRPKVYSEMVALERMLALEASVNAFDKSVWKSSATLEDLLRLRRSLCSALTTSPDGLGNVSSERLGIVNEQFSSIQDVTQVIAQEVAGLDVDDKLAKPYFCEESECLRQYSWSSGSPSLDARVELDVLSSRTTSIFATLPGAPASDALLNHLPNYTGIDTKGCRLSALRGMLFIDLMKKLSNLGETPLRSLDRLTEESTLFVSQLANSTPAIIADQSSVCERLFSSVTVHVLLSLRQYLQPELLSQLEYLAQDVRLDLKADSLPNYHAGSLYLDERSTERAQQILKRYLQPALDYLLGSRDAQNYDHRLPDAGLAWMKLFVGCLKLYVPNIPVDPALQSIIDAERCLVRNKELRTRLAALEEFDKRTDNQTSNLRRELILQRLKNLGEEYPVTAIARPTESKVLQIQEEFNAILNILLPSCDNFLTSLEIDTSEQVRTLQANVQRILRRLINRYREYDDLIKPLIAFLQGLDVGLALCAAEASIDRDVQRDAEPKSLGPTLLGLSLQHTFAFTDMEGSAQRWSPSDQRIVFLQYAAMEKHITGELRQDLLIDTAGVFETLHSEWKFRLEKEQKEETARSSMYRYRGQDETEEVEDRELEQLFPYSSSEKADQETLSKENRMNPQALAILLSQLHGEVFNDESTMSKTLARLVTNSVKALSATSNEKSHASNERHTSLLPGVVLSTSDCIENLRGTQLQSKAPNFYHESNVSEARRLLTLLRSIRTKFNHLQERWPDHATLVEVLHTIEEILSIEHTAPLAKLIPKAEKLHSLVHEWQSVASREFSVQTYYDGITKLLISWRRIELSSWSELLDVEDQSQQKEASSWFFILYEAIFSVDLGLGADKRGSLAALLEELQRFLKTSPIGQFSTRLGMISSFIQELSHRSLIAPAFGPVVGALISLVQYASRWTTQISLAIKNEREALGRKMKEVLLLASWKDTNVLALRESARKSHRALFKSVRKYRDILSQPVEGQLKLPQDNEVRGLTEESKAYHFEKSHLDQRAAELCQHRFATWPRHALRLHDPERTARLVALMSSVPEQELDSPLFITSFRQSFVASTNALKQETPKTETESNRPVIKHLKARKRNLLADTIKTIRKMGTRSNLDSATLEEQRDISRILACTPTCPELVNSQSDFFGVLDRVILARDSIKQHSQDLTPSEVSRCMGSLEGMLRHLIKQRQAIGDYCKDLEAYDRMLARLGALWRPEDGIVQVRPTEALDFTKRANKLRWLREILSGSDAVIEKVEKMGELQFPAVRKGLQQFNEKIGIILGSMNLLPTLPTGLLSLSRKTELLAMDQLCTEMQVKIGKWSLDFPQTRFVLQHIQPWLQKDVQFQPIRKTRRGSTELGSDDSSNAILEGSETSKFDEQQVFDAVDSMLVGVQHLKPIFEDLPASSDEVGWLLNEEKSLRKANKALQLPFFTALLNGLFLSSLPKSEPQQLHPACALSAVILPIVQEYRNAYAAILNKRLATHDSLCGLALVLSNAFQEILQQGFCAPKGNASEEAPSDNVEEGVGLGEGEGVEDVSGQIDEDEDLTGLKEPATGESEDTEDLTSEDNAIDVKDDEVGDMNEGTGSRQADENEDGNVTDEEDGKDVSDEVGSVDDLDPSAVDENLWHGEASGSPQREGRAKGERDDDLSTRIQEESETRSLESVSNAGEEDAYEHETEEPVQSIPDRMDPNLTQDENLDLPDDMDVDAVNGSPLSIDSDDLNEFSDVDEKDAAGSDVSGDAQDDVELEDADKTNNMEDIPQNEDKERRQDNSLPNDEVSKEEKIESEQPLVDRHENDNLGDPDLGELDDMIGTSTLEEPGAQNKPREMTAIDRQQDDMEQKLGGNSAPDDAVAEEAQTDQDQNESKGDSSLQNHKLPPFRKLAEVIEKWHQANQDIQMPTSEQPESSHENSKQKPTDQVQHLLDRDDSADATALDAAMDSEAQALNEHDIEALEDSTLLDREMNEDNSPAPASMDKILAFESEEAGADPLGPSVAKEDPAALDRGRAEVGLSDNQDDKMFEDLDSELSEVRLDAQDEPQLSLEDARRLYTRFEEATRQLSLSLTEQLRLILAPSQAIKMRGDFKTGKRLNVKRVIPYIASQYKRDKIWMRRSIPSKRNYQVMIAVDDSKSMEERGSGKLALESLVLICRSLSMLEIGQICVASFGETFRVPHHFDQQFSNEAAVNIFQHFNFQQRRTKLRGLLEASIEAFRQARSKQVTSGADQWQLQLIISDGDCDRDPYIERLIRQAYDERIMIIFTIVDVSTKGSILTWKDAHYAADESGQLQATTTPYLDSFPFPFYLIVHDLRELPNMLSATLKQWFSEISQSS